jgi:hypothetical protein
MRGGNALKYEQLGVHTSLIVGLIIRLLYNDVQMRKDRQLGEA